MRLPLPGPLTIIRHGLLAGILAVGLSLHAQAAATDALIDGAHLPGATSLDVPWRFQAGDDPAFALPGFDDSAWSPRKPGSALQVDNAAALWLRLSLHVVNATGPLAIALRTPYGLPYAVFADGRQIAASPSYAQGERQASRPFAIALPWNRVAEQRILLAIRVPVPPGPALRELPLRQITLGPLAAVRSATELDRLTEFDRKYLASAVFAVVFLVFGPVGFILFLAQREHTEYLWLGLFCVSIGLAILVANADDAGLISASRLNRFALDLSGFAALICGLEFVARFSSVRDLRPVRVLQAFMLAGPVLHLVALPVYRITVPASIALFLAFISFYMLEAYRHGKEESGLLLPPLAFFAAVQLLERIATSFPERLPLATGWHLGHVGLSLYDLANFGFLAGILAVVLHRFVRVSTDEQRSAAEMEAARTVQRLLLPVTSPPTPGFRVESVYEPARVVGGDFFLILPEARDGSLLVVMGDVSGKGLQAAMVASEIVGAVRVQLTRQPAAVLEHVNRVLSSFAGGSATCCAVLLHADGAMQLANAGNPAPYRNRQEIATVPGIPLGFLADAAYEEMQQHLAPGEQLTFVSDGIIEARHPVSRELFGFDRTQAASDQTAAAIAEAARRFTAGGPQDDDITVLTVTRSHLAGAVSP